MKKQLLVLFLSASTLSFAQVRIGALAGGNLMTQKFSEDPKSGNMVLKSSSIPAYHFGVLFSVPITEGVFFQPGLNYQVKGGKLSGSAKEIINRVTITGDIKSEATLHYLELPVNISLALEAGGGGGVKVTPYLGLYAAYAMSGKGTATTTATVRGVTRSIPESIDAKFSGNDKNTERMDYGGQLGVGLEINKIFFRLQYSLGLVNVLSVKLANIDTDDGDTIKNRGFGLSVGYWINNAK